MNTTSLKSKVAAAFIAFLALPVMALAQTWTAPLGAPPGNNTPAPVNVGGSAQTKLGDLTLQSDVTFNGSSDPASVLSSWITSGFFGNVVIGNPLAGSNAGPYPTLNVNGKFRFIPRTVGSPASAIGNNWILTTDTLGYGKWSDPSTIPNLGSDVAVSVNGDPVTSALNSINFIGTGISAPPTATGDVNLTVISGATPGSLPPGTAVGQTLFWNGTTWLPTSNVKTNPTATDYFLVDSPVGDLRVDSAGVTYTSFLGVSQITNLSGSISIGDGVGAADTIRILPQGSVPAAGKILASVDATGKVAWQTPGIGSSAGTPVVVNDEGDLLTSGVTSVNFTGPGVTATATGNNVTVNVSGGGSGTLPTGENVDHILAWDEDASQWISAGLEFVIPGTNNQTLRYNGATNDWTASSAILNDEPNSKLYVGNESNTNLVYVAGDEVDLFSPNVKITSPMLQLNGAGMFADQGRLLVSQDTNGTSKWTRNIKYTEGVSPPYAGLFKITNPTPTFASTFVNEGNSNLSGNINIINGEGLYIDNIPLPASTSGIARICVDTNGEDDNLSTTFDNNQVVKCKAEPGAVIVSGSGSVASSGTGTEAMINCTGEALGPNSRRSKFCSFVVPEDVVSLNVRLLSAGGGGGGGGAGWEAGNEAGGGGGGGGGGGAFSQYTVPTTPGTTLYMLIGIGGNGGMMGGRYGNSGGVIHTAGAGAAGGDTYITSSSAVSLSSAAYPGTSKVFGGNGGEGGSAGETILTPNGGGGFDHWGQPGGIGGNGGIGVTLGQNGSDGGYGMADDAGVTGGVGGDAGTLVGGPGGTAAFIQNDIDGDGLSSSDPNTRFFGVRGKTGQDANAGSIILAGGGSGGGGGEGVSLGTYIFSGVVAQGLNVNPPANWASLGQIPLNYCRRNLGDDQKNCGGRGGNGGDGAIQIYW